MVMAPQTPRYHIYHAWELAPLFVLAVAGLALHGDLAGWCLILSWGYALVRDWRGTATLRGRIPWHRLPRVAAILAIVAYAVLYPLVFPVYVALAAWDTWQWHQGQPLRTRQRIAQLERALNIQQPGE